MPASDTHLVIMNITKAHPVDAIPKLIHLTCHI